MAKKVCLINMKGGVGKSTITVNLAYHFAFKDKNNRVLVVDLDPQFNASQYLIGVSAYKKIIEDNLPTMWNIFEQFTPMPGSPKSTPLDPDKVIHQAKKMHSGGYIHLIPSRLELAFSLKNPGQKEQLLAKFLKKVEDKYDIILLDCPPTESLFTTAAYLSSEYILVPVKPEYLSSIGLPLLVNSMGEFKKQYEANKLELAGIMFNATSNYSPEEKKSKSEVKQIAEDNGWYVFQNEVHSSRSYPKGAREGKPISRTSYARYSKAANFSAFAEEFAKGLGL